MTNTSLLDQFPLLKEKVRGHRLAYLDNAATTQKPLPVLEEMDRIYRTLNANVHRGVHTLSQQATDAFEEARAKVARFIKASEPAEVIFTKGCTESINLVAQSWGLANLKPGDEILLSHGEHHANIVPWQLAAERCGAVVRPIPIFESGELDLKALSEMVSSKTKVVGIKHVCNALGTINPIAEVVRLAHSVGAICIVDGAQGLAHEPVDVQAWGVDFYAMSAHKTYGPMGVGALYGKRSLLESMPPFMGGGDMIRTVSFDGTTFNEIPNKFEPGTPNVPGVVGFGAALDWLAAFGLPQATAIENDLADRAAAELSSLPGVVLRGTASQKVGIVSFTLDSVHPHDIGTILDSEGVAVRTGHHCCMPLMRRLNVPATVRASFALYNQPEDVEALIKGVQKVQKIFA
ncbi:MAG: cysteine desulfurase [Fimbriimonadaceae bacterium]|nr:cysteine desulfurase [Fimbriimonadaceae bacterium]